MQSSVKVFVRVRPLSAREERRGGKGDSVAVSPSATRLAMAAKVSPPLSQSVPGIPPGLPNPGGAGASLEFSFDRVFQHQTQEDVFEHAGRDLLDHALEGYNTCLFAYGQTGSGKSHTMMGTPSDKGLIPRICDHLFLRINDNQLPEKAFTVTVSYIEIYNEKVRDLLNSNPSNKNTNLRVREHPTLGPYVEDVSKLVVTSYDQIERLMDLGNKARTTAATNMNDTSSRSHAVFTVNLSQTITSSPSNESPVKLERSSQTITSPPSDESPVKLERSSRICLVDLAGSERAESTGATGVRLKEGANINKSLTTLGKVISTLAEASSNEVVSLSRKSSAKSLKAVAAGGGGGAMEGTSNAATSPSRSSVFVPYRDSTLTWLLKDCLGGNSKTVMVATISPSDTSYDETLSTLRYADRAKKIVNRAVVNEDETGKTVRILQEEVGKLKRKLAAYEERSRGWEAGEEVVSPTSTNGSRRASLLSLDGFGFSGEGGGTGLVRRLSTVSMGSSSSVFSEGRDPDALYDQLVASEKLIAEMTESYEAKLQRSMDMETQQTNMLKELGLRFETSASGSVAVHAPKTTPHLVNLSEDPSVSECLLFRLPIGIHGVGNTPQSAIFLESPSILREHAFFECIEPAATTVGGDATTPNPILNVYLRPNPESLTYLNALPINQPVKLTSGDRILFGATAFFKFVNPAELAVVSSRGGGGGMGLSYPPLPVSPNSSNNSSYYSNGMSNRSAVSSPTRSAGRITESASYARGGVASSTDEQATYTYGGPQPRMMGLPERLKQQSVASSAGSSAASRRLSLWNLLSEEEVGVARRVVRKWRGRNYVRLAQEILKSAVLLKEANVISKELHKNVFYEFEIIESSDQFKSASFWEAQPSYDASAPTSLNASRSRQSSAMSLGPGSIAAAPGKPFVAVRVLDGEHNSVYRWTLGEFKTRLTSMRTLYNYVEPDATPSSFYAHQRAITSELSFYAAGEVYPYYERVGSVWVDVRGLGVGVLREVRAPVLGEGGGVLGWVLVVVAPISVGDAGGCRGEEVGEDGGVVDAGVVGGGGLTVGNTLVFEVSVLEATGFKETEYTQVHCQFRLSEFMGRVGGGDRVFATDPVEGFGEAAVRWNFSQTISMEVTEEVKRVVEGDGVARFEVFARRRRAVGDVIGDRFCVGAVGSGGAGAVASLAGAVAMSKGINEDQEFKKHVILVQIEISELSSSTGEFKPVPVQTSVKQSETLKTEFRSHADVFLIRQGIQRRITIRLSHSSGKYNLPWRRVSFVKIGQIRRIDLKTNRPLDDESDSRDMVDLQVPGLDERSSVVGGGGGGPGGDKRGSFLQNQPFFSNNGQSSLEIEIPWDTSVHRNLNLNRPTKGFRLELTIQWGVEVDPLNDRFDSPATTGGDEETGIGSQWNVFASAVQFEKQIAVVVHDRDFKVQASATAMSFLSMVGIGGGSSGTPARYAARSNSLFVVETFPVSDMSVAAAALEVPKASQARALMGEIDTCGGRREVERRLKELAVVKARIVEVEMGGRVEEVRGLMGEQERRVLLAKCVEMSLLYDQKCENKVDDGEEVKFVSTRCKQMLEMAPPSFRGALLTPDSDDNWVKRYFVIRRPYLHMHADASDLDELAIFSLANTKIQFGASLGSTFQGKSNVFAIHSKDCSLLLQASSAAEMNAWLSAVDPLRAGVLLSRKRDVSNSSNNN
ncbi:kinesin-like protein Klp8 [Podochytrium sp. JEL0797]|nr:kinesin-like protein Klp8 [Podochytrium sp. JEL0797]